MPWLEIGVGAIIVGLIALVIRYARSDANGEQRVETAEKSTEVAEAMADRPPPARNLSELKERAARRRARRRRR